MELSPEGSIFFIKYSITDAPALPSQSAAAS